MKRINQLFLLILCACFFGAAINAQPKQDSTKGGDARVEKALKQTKTEYEVEKDGMYKVTLGTTGKRSQAAFIVSETDKIYGSEMRGVFSYAMISDDSPSPEITNLLLAQNMENVSFWAIQKEKDGKFAIINIIYIPADADGKKLDWALKNVILAADEMEERLTKKDEF
ncbi:MAG: hypothetical protein ACR2N3_05995 [Pyrinomonadaceae bacterium]